MSTGSNSRDQAESFNYDFMYISYPISDTPQQTYDRMVNVLGQGQVFRTAVLLVPVTTLGSPPTVTQFQTTACLAIPIRDNSGDDVRPIFQNIQTQRFFNNVSGATYTNSTGSNIIWSIDECPLLDFNGIHLFDNPYRVSNITDLQAPLISGTNPLRARLPNNNQWIFFNINFSETTTVYNQNWLTDFHSQYHLRLISNARFRYRSGYSIIDLDNQITGGGGGGGGTLAGLSDVALTSLTPGEVLTYDGTKWTNQVDYKRTVEGAPYKLVSGANNPGEFDFQDSSQVSTRNIADIRNVRINKTSLDGLVANWITTFGVGFSQDLKFRCIDPSVEDVLAQIRITAFSSNATQVAYNFTNGLRNEGSNTPTTLTEGSIWMLEHPFSSMSGTAFAELSDVQVVPQQSGQVVHYNSVTSKWEQAQELTVDPVTRDVISVTSGLFSQVAGGSVSMGSIGAEANVQGQTDVNIAAVTGNVLMEAQAGTVDVLSLASTTNVQAQTGVTVQTLTGNAVLSAVSGNVNITGNQNANLTASNQDVNVTALVGNIVGSAQNNMQLEAQAGQLFLRGQTAAQMRATTGNMLLIAQSGNVTVQANGDLACSAQNDANFTGNNFCSVTGQNQLDLSCLTGPANLTADGDISVQSATGSIKTVSNIFEIQNAGSAPAITYDNGAGTFRTSIPSYEANMVGDSFATKDYVDGVAGSSTYAGLTDVDLTGLDPGAIACRWNDLTGKFTPANQFKVDPTTNNVTIYTGADATLEADNLVTVNGVGQLDLTSTSGQVNISAPGDQLSITTGDALIMQSTVGLVTKSDQQDFRNQANTATALSINTTANTVRTLLPSYEASMVGSSLATKTYVDSVFAPVANAVLDGGNTITSGNLELGTNSNNNLHLRAFGQDKFIIQNTVGTATLTGNLPMVIRPFASASAPLVTITGGDKSTAGGVGGNLILAGGATLGGTAVNSGNVQIQGSTGLGFLLTGSSGLLASNVAGYEALVTTPNSIPNKQFIDNLTLNSLADTTISSVALSDTLIYNGTQWVNRPAVYGMCYWTNNAVAENGGVAINLATPYKPSAAATTSLFLKNMTHTTPNRLTYTGTASIIAEVSYQLASNVGNNDRSFLVYVRKNGSDVVQSRTVNVSKDTVQGSDGCNNQFLLDLAQNDFVEIFVTNISAGATTLTIRELNLSVKLVDYQ